MIVDRSTRLICVIICNKRFKIFIVRLLIAFLLKRLILFFVYCDAYFYKKKLYDIYAYFIKIYQNLITKKL